MDYKVNRGLLVGSAPQGRFAEERRILAAYFPGFTLHQSYGDSNSAGNATGRLKTFAHRSYALRILLPADYPDDPPAIIPDGWTPNKNPHLYVNGNICVMRPEQWHPFMSVAFLVGRSAIWLNKYEIYIDKGIWPGAEQHTHGRIYNVRKWWHEL